MLSARLARTTAGLVTPRRALSSYLSRAALSPSSSSPFPTLRFISSPTTRTLEQHARSMATNAQKDITSWASKDGQFRRQSSAFRDSISKDAKFKPDKGRYVLYVSLACPWA